MSNRAKKLVQHPVYSSRTERDRKNDYRRQVKHRDDPCRQSSD